MIFRSKPKNRRLRLIVGTSGLPLLFSSIQSAESYLEGIDVDNGEYSYAISPDGTRYKLLSDGANGVIILPDREAPADPDAAREALVALAQREHGTIGADAPLDALIECCRRAIDDGV